MSKRAILSVAPVIIVGLVAGCANVPWQPPAYETAIKSYYEAHASEYHGYCLAPYIDGFAKVQVVEETPDRFVVDARYLYRDWVKDQRQTDDTEAFSRECVGYNQRTFVLARNDDSVQVTEMTGPRRN
jgi:hypothetical protein